MKMSDGLFLSCCKEVSKEYPEIEFQDMIIDNCAMQMVSRPEQFDVMVIRHESCDLLIHPSKGLSVENF